MHRQCYNMGCAKAHTATFLSWMLYLSTAKKWGWAYPLSTLNTSELRYTGVHHNTCIAIFPKKGFLLAYRWWPYHNFQPQHDAHSQTSANKATLTPSGIFFAKGNISPAQVWLWLQALPCPSTSQNTIITQHQCFYHSHDGPEPIPRTANTPLDDLI